VKQLLIGVLDDGSARDESMPRSSATTLVVPSGESHTIDVRVFYPSGVPVLVGDLSGLEAQLVVNCTVDPCQRIPDRTFVGTLPSDPVGNLVRFDVPFSAFRGTKPGRYLFEVWLRQTATRIQIIRTSGWILTPALIR
jgi:hypothetical protein